jgi:hypothetical protein
LLKLSPRLRPRAEIPWLRWPGTSMRAALCFKAHPFKLASGNRGEAKRCVHVCAATPPRLGMDRVAARLVYGSAGQPGPPKTTRVSLNTRAQSSAVTWAWVRSRTRLATRARFPPKCLLRIQNFAPVYWHEDAPAVQAATPSSGFGSPWDDTELRSGLPRLPPPSLHQCGF